MQISGVKCGPALLDRVCLSLLKRWTLRDILSRKIRELEARLALYESTGSHGGQYMGKIFFMRLRDILIVSMIETGRSDVDSPSARTVSSHPVTEIRSSEPEQPVQRMSFAYVKGLIS